MHYWMAIVMSNYSRNHYEVIGLPPDASQEDIEANCLRLGERYRPDKNPDDVVAAREFARVEEAYETLRDREKRAAYDAELRSQNSQSTRTKSSFGLATGIASALAILVACGYVFAYRPYIAHVEEGKRLAAEETRKLAAEETRRAAEARAQAIATENARILEAQSRAAEERARIRESQARAAEERARITEARLVDSREAANYDARARAEAKELARIDMLRELCQAYAAASKGGRSPAASFASSNMALKYCVPYEQAMKERQYYESLKRQGR
jgi:curved DNA-binding protein CbpA